jgi:hypothetical protein
MSINDQVKEEVQRQIDIAVEEIPYEKRRWSKSAAKSRLQYKDISDFLLGFECGRILEYGIWYYRRTVFENAIFQVPYMIMIPSLSRINVAKYLGLSIQINQTYPS